ncbi:unnamed protein product [Cylicostephanus goldi]|uniref:Ig-like domain-containing protein n=1 Tax=Cylicostephanus goldi TaxID=71465 RepID=A0A3P7MMZ9_CYLGO|nr:unnamed protein product [Cylicostephanus goldi]
MSTPQEKEVNEGEPASFRCDAVGNPSPTILWTRAGDDQILSKGDTWQQGEYICTAVVEGFKHASVSHFLHIRGPPIITVPAEVAADVGETVEMSCHVSGRPKPLEVNWKKNGEDLDYASGKMQVHQIPRSYGVESRLIIRDLREIDMGAYNCTANNGIGADAKTVTLQPRGVANLFGRLFSCFSFLYSQVRPFLRRAFFMCFSFYVLTAIFCFFHVTVIFFQLTLVQPHWWHLLQPCSRYSYSSAVA